MPDPRQYVRPGQRLQIAASQINALNEMMRVDTGFRAGPQRAPEMASNIVLVKNVSGQAIPWFGVIGISGVAIDPSGGVLSGGGAADLRAREFASRPVLTGIHPGQSINVGDKIAIAMEPIASGAIGRAAVGGCFPCKVYIEKASHGFAVPMRTMQVDQTRYPGGSIWELYSADCGPVMLLWKETGQVISDRWAVGLM